MAEETPRPIESPHNEAEVPPSDAPSRNANKEPNETEKLNPKESSAFLLTVWCLVGFVLFGLVAMHCVPDLRESVVHEVLDILKYVVTTSLGFFFATSRKK